MVHLTRIYTRTGDDGSTALVDMSRTSKNDARLIAYADTDETNSHIGVAIAHGGLADDILVILQRVQNDLFDVGADVGNPIVAEPRWEPLRVTPEYVERLEQWCDEFNGRTPKLDSFILPGGSRTSAQLHVARTVARRAERSTWAAIEEHGESMNVLTAKYLNRLSDLLFILARVANTEESGGTGDILWVPGGER